MEKIYTLTGQKAVVPAPVYTTVSGFTASGTNKLTYNGTDNIGLTLTRFTNPWLYFPIAGILVKVESFVDGGIMIYGPQGNAYTVSNEQAQVTEATLVDMQLDNTTASSAATVNGANLNAGHPLHERAQSIRGSKPLDPVIVDATNSSVRVVESR